MLQLELYPGYLNKPTTLRYFATACCSTIAKPLRYMSIIMQSLTDQVLPCEAVCLRYLPCCSKTQFLLFQDFIPAE